MPEMNYTQSPFAYVGVEPVATPNLKKVARDPASSDRKNFFIGDMWLNTSNKKVWMLTGIVGNAATWSNFVNSGILISTYVADSGSATPSSNVIEVRGDSLFVSSTGSGNTVSLSMIARGDNGELLIGATGGDPAWANLTSTGGTVNITNTGNGINLEDAGPYVVTLSSDSGSAFGSGNNIQVAGSTYVSTSAAGKTITIDLDSSVTIGTLLTLSSLGAGVVQTNGAGLWSSTNGTSGQLLIASGAGVPAWAALASSDASVSITNASNSIDISIPSVVVSPYTFYGFSSYSSGSQFVDVTGNGTEYTMTFNDPDFDPNGDFSVTTFTAPTTGKYYLYLFMQLDVDPSGGYYWRPAIKVNSFYYYGLTAPTYNRYSSYESSTKVAFYGLVTGYAFCLVSMTAGQTATAIVQSAGGSKIDDIVREWRDSNSVVPPYFTGYLVSNI